MHRKIVHPHEISFQDEVLENSMTLLLGLNHTIFSQVSHSRIKGVFHEFVKRPTILEIESKQYAYANVFKIINALVALQDN